MITITFFTLLDIGDHGRQNDGGVFSNSMFGRAMMNNSLSIPEPEVIHGQKKTTPFFFVGDSAFLLKKFMLRPFLVNTYLTTKGFLIIAFLNPEG